MYGEDVSKLSEGLKGRENPQELQICSNYICILLA